MKYILGKKLGMLQLFDVNGKQLAATVIHCEPNEVLEVKTAPKHKHNAIKVGYLQVNNEKRVNNPIRGIFKKVNAKVRRHIVEFRDMDGYKVNDLIKVSIFEKGQYVDVQGTTKGHGFTGAIKRWNFHIGSLGHGHGYPHRYQGSLAMGRGGSQAQRVAKGKKMSGHYGNETVTVQNLVVLDVIERRNIIILLGAIPGPTGSVVKIKTSAKFPEKKSDIQIITRELKEEILEHNAELEDKEALHQANEQAQAEQDAAIKAEEAAKKAEAEARAKEEKNQAK